MRTDLIKAVTRSKCGVSPRKNWGRDDLQFSVFSEPNASCRVFERQVEVRQGLSSLAVLATRPWEAAEGFLGRWCEGRAARWRQGR